MPETANDGVRWDKSTRDGVMDGALAVAAPASALTIWLELTLGGGVGLMNQHF